MRLTAFDIDGDGALYNRRLWAELGARPPDGICLDADGNVWVANPLEPVCFRSPRAAASSTRSRPTSRASPACSAVRSAGILFMLTAANSDESVAARRARDTSSSPRCRRPVPAGRDMAP